MLSIYVNLNYTRTFTDIPCAIKDYKTRTEDINLYKGQIVIDIAFDARLVVWNSTVLYCYSLEMSYGPYGL